MTESEWDDEQRGLVIAEQIVRNMTGPNGEWMPEATAPVTEQMEKRYRYVPDGPHVNAAEKARLDAVDAHRKSMGDNANLNGVYFTVRKDEY